MKTITTLFTSTNFISNLSSNIQKYLIVFIMLSTILVEGHCQALDNILNQDFQYIGCLLTDRNCPILHTKEDSTIIPCRKIKSQQVIFWNNNYAQDISDYLNKPYDELTENDKELIINNTWHSKDTALFNIVIKIARNDTIKTHEYNRYNSIRCLSQFNNDLSKKTLINLLNDKKFGILSALSLIQLGITDISFKYIQNHYNDNDIFHHSLKIEIITASMLINNPDAIKLLMKFSEEKDPSYALDAFGALSLLGYCDFAFKGFCKYVNSEIWQVRQKVAWCLAYYIGTYEAFGIIKNMQNDEDIEVQRDINKILRIYNIKN